MNNNVKGIYGIAAALGIAIAAAIPVSAAKPVAIEKELLGVRVLQNYRSVLLKYGAPNRVFRATETITYDEEVNLAGVGTGGIKGIAGSTSGGGGGGGMKGGGPMGSGGPMMGNSAGGRGGSGGPMGAMMLPTGGSSAGPSGGSGGGGGSAAPGDNPDGSYGEAGGFTWVYLYPGKRLAYEFHFNKDGRVERIAELGNAWGQHTTRGIGLGDSLDKIYGTYGWTDRIKEEDTSRFSLLYNNKYHAQFLVLKNRVVGISVFLKENQFTDFHGTSGGSGGSGMAAGGPAGPGGGMMGAAMMPSSSGPSRGGGGGGMSKGKMGAAGRN